jgi:hypothetical protein
MKQRDHQDKAGGRQPPRFVFFVLDFMGLVDRLLPEKPCDAS